MMQILPPRFDYKSVGPYTAIVINGTGVVRSKSKRRLTKAMAAMYALSDDTCRWKAVHDCRGYVMFAYILGKTAVGCGEAFEALNELAQNVEDPNIYDDLLTLELASRMMWPVDA